MRSIQPPRQRAAAIAASSRGRFHVFRQVIIVCPCCDAETAINVSGGNGKDVRGSSSPCRACKHAIVTLTLADGQVLLQKDGELFSLGRLADARESPSRRGAGKRHQIVPPQNLGLFDRGEAMQTPLGISDEEFEQRPIVNLDRLLWRPDGTRRPAADIARRHGLRSLWIAELNHNLRRRLSQPPPFSEPPSVFLSYRWGGDPHRRWVAGLAAKLTERGYRVTLDQLVAPDEMDVPAFVSGIVDCQYFLAIIDPGYVERLGSPNTSTVVDGWVFDEVNTAFALENSGLIRVVGLLREGEVLPSQFNFASLGQPGNTVDVRDGAQLDDFVDDAFPDRREVADATDLAAAGQLYAASIDALGRGDYQQAFDLAAELIARAPALIDGHVQEVRVCIASGARKAGLAAATAAIDRFPGLAELDLAAADFAWELGEAAQAAKHAARVLQAAKLPEGRRGSAHAVLGSVLDDVDQVDAAVGHLDLAIKLLGRQPLLLRNLGFIARRMGHPRRAAALFAEALEAEPASEPLRINQVSALIEAGEAGLAREALAALTRVSTDQKTIAILDDTLAQLEATGIPVTMVRRAPIAQGALEIRCSNCQVCLPADEAQSLCAGCGCVRQPDAALCRFCEADGQVPILTAGSGPESICPFCRKGVISASRRR
jgi:tetratricopeptide (TPR) repeat protein